MEGSLSLVLALMLDEASSPFNRALDGRKTYIFLVDGGLRRRSPDPNQLSIVGCSLCAATTLSDDGSRAYARSWKIQEDYVCLDGYEGINGWENMDGLENSTVTWNSRVTSVENYTAMKWPVDCLHYTRVPFDYHI
ncbi:hypothetical protein Bca4012_073480 [Brassica carinata]